ncbi:ABC transporter substrate-binding protein [Roseomonas sp. SSH11]|uniref:ABC transporter substrate-binding protein n=1 Tax=Pararoseomonas baculiformis TaxID=2820812 RepID=A0ABS4A9X3_9PROT|nr:ABC transporter substrate-binding protein [Pararoseomonas baculiformis]MBP0443806.1 ABC transporter substrate-binding protein [Pararoseomonas baculiformis]
MTISRKDFLKLGAAGTLALGLPRLARAADPIKVGALFPLSGGAAVQGQHVCEAIEIAAAMVNDAGGVLGRPVQILRRDDESTPAVGVSRANELIGEGVAVVIEGWNSPVTLAIQTVLARAGVLDITAISKADQILTGGGNPLAVRLNSSNAQDGRVIAEHLKATGAKRIAFLTQNDAYGNGAQASIENELKAIGHDYTKVAEEKFPFAQADFRVALTNVRGSNADAVVAINANEGSGLPALIRQARQMRLRGDFVTAVGTVAPSVIQVAGEAANGIIGADIYFPKEEPFASNPVNQDFVRRAEEKIRYTPDKFMALGAGALQVWAMAANELKTLEREKIGARIRGGSFQGTVLGDARFSPEGQLASSHRLFTVKDGKIEVRA